MKKPVSIETSPINKHLSQFTDEHPLMEWLEENGKKLLLSLLALTLLLFIAYRYSSGNAAKAESDYYEATQQFQLFQKNNDADALAKLQVILDRRPELHPKFDGLIAQKLIERNDPSQAETYASLISKRLASDHIPYYENFSAITLLISKGDYTQSLKQSQQLKQTLLKSATEAKENREFGDLLFAYNLLRIAMLEHKAGSPEGEKAAWSEWKEYTKASVNSASIKAGSFYILDSLFGEGVLTLNDYIESREKALR